MEGDGAGWLLIDDLVDTGRTAKAVRDTLPRAHFATLYAKPQGRPIVDTFVKEFRQTQWIFFPWDIDYRFVSRSRRRSRRRRSPRLRDGAAPEPSPLRANTAGAPRVPREERARNGIRVRPQPMSESGHPAKAGSARTSLGGGRPWGSTPFARVSIRVWRDRGSEQGARAEARSRRALS